MEIRQFIYVSRLSGRIAENGLRQIMQRSRENNAKRNLTGALLFDGEAFAQLIEGRSDEVLGLVNAIRADAGHEAFMPVFDGKIPGERHFGTWQNGYVEPEAIEDFRADCKRTSADLTHGPSLVLDSFVKLLAKADVI